ncbi:MAG: hypothetical protein R3F49_21900 [Planctomycetota bacterium]
MDGLVLTEGAAARAAALSLDFLARFFEAELTRRPENLEALAELGHLYTRLGRYMEGLAVDRQLVAALPEDSTAHYNLACSLALTGDLDGAFAALERSLDLGYDDGELIAEDEDLAPLHADPRFGELLRRLGVELPPPAAG